MRRTVFLLLFISAYVGSLEARTTIKWTGAGGDFKIGTVGNWTPTPSFSSNNLYDLDLTDVPAGTELRNDLGKNVLYLGNITLGDIRGEVTLLAGGGPKIGPATWTIPTGATLVFYNFSYQNAGQDGSGTVTITGGGTVRTSTYGWSLPNEDWRVDGATVRLGCWVNHKMGGWTILNGGRLELDRYDTNAGRLVLNDGSTVDIGSGMVELTGGHVWRASQIDGTVLGSGLLFPHGSFSHQIGSTADFSGFSGTVRLGNASLMVATGATLGNAIHLETANLGRLELGESATLASVKGEGVNGGVVIPSGSTLTIIGDGTKRSDDFKGRLSGEGSFVMDDPNGLLNFSGQSAYVGSTTVNRGCVVYSSGAERVYPSGLIGRWSFEDAADLGKNSADITNPIIREKNESPWPEQRSGGVAGAYLHFDHTVNSWLITSAASSTIKGTKTSWSLVMWVRVDPESISERPVLFYEEYGGNGAYFQLGADSGRYCMAGRVGGGWVFSGWPSRLADGQWHQLCMTQSGNVRSYYLDGGAAKDTTTADWTSQYGLLRFGHCDGWGKFGGDMDEILLFDRGLTEAEVKDLYDNPGQSFTPVVTVADIPSPDLNWTFDDKNDFGKEVICGAGLTMVGTPKDTTTDYETMGMMVCIGAFSPASYMKSEWSAKPVGMPSGDTDWTLALRIQGDAFSGWDPGDQGATPFILGDPTTAGKFFRLVVRSSPRTYAYTTTVLKGDSGVPGLPYVALGSLEHEGTHAGVSPFIFVYDSTAKKITAYLDGVKVLETSETVDLPSVPQVYLCKNPNNSGEKVYQWFDDIRVYKRKFTAEQVRVLAASYRTGTIDPVMPKNAAITVNANGVVQVSAGDLSAYAITGEGTLAIDGGAKLGIESATTFAGSLVGFGTLEAKDALTLTGDGSKFRGTITTTGKALTLGSSYDGVRKAVAENAVIPMTSAGSDTPAIGVSGSLELPAQATIAFSDTVEDVFAARRRYYPIAAATTLVEPTDYSGWSVTPSSDLYEPSFLVKDGVLTLWLHRKRGMILLLR